MFLDFSKNKFVFFPIKTFPVRRRINILICLLSEQQPFMYYRDGLEMVNKGNQPVA